MPGGIRGEGIDARRRQGRGASMPDGIRGEAGDEKKT